MFNSRFAVVLACVGAAVALTVILSSGPAVGVAQGAAAAKGGVVEGVITEKKETAIRIKEDNGTTETYTPRWIGGADGHLDAEMLTTIKRTPVGSRVKVLWKLDEHRRLVSLTVIEEAKKPASEPAQKSGTVVGTVSEKGKDWIRVKSDAGKSERYVPQWAGKADGGYDKEILGKIAAVKVGQRVEVKWVFQERPRVVELNVVGERTSRVGGAGNAKRSWAAPREPVQIALNVSDAWKYQQERSGSVMAVVEAKGEDWIRVTPVDGPNTEPLTLSPRWITRGGGHYDKQMMGMIHLVQVGLLVQVKWTYDGDLRLTGLYPATESGQIAPGE